jgi:hypothetical protein
VRQQRLEFGGLFLSSWMARFVGFIGCPFDVCVIDILFFLLL